MTATMTDPQTWWMFLKGPKRPVAYSTDEDLDKAIGAAETGPRCAVCQHPLGALSVSTTGRVRCRN
jgi:hypothetical protein